MSLPERFKERMTLLLGESEASRLFRAIEDSDAVKAFRINRIKTAKTDFEASEPEIDKKSIDFPPDAYITREEFPGSLACHHSGAIYMQDISAMSTVHAVKLDEGMHVLDSCSAPGGKTTQLSAMVGDRGVVVANEYDKKRCRVLRGNVERMGCKNTVVCNLDTAWLAKVYPNAFDLVLCDAPCSGEGMFRKNVRAVEEWSEENVKMCAERQREILENVAKCVKMGGRLIYSTCTFSLEENEENVARFLDTHPDFALADADDALVEHTSEGLVVEGCEYDMKKCRRIYPHLSLGEGQFIAVFERAGEKASPRGEALAEQVMRDKNQKRGAENKRSRAEIDAIFAAEQFLRENLQKMPDGELRMLGELIFLSPKIELPPYNVLAAGVCVGEAVKGRVLPHHQLFSAYGHDFKLKIELDGKSEEAKRYLRGEEIDCSAQVGGESGWCAVMIDGCATGGGKVSGGRCKNHYPKGLRE